jgi:glutathionylspermidine synthase
MTAAMVAPATTSEPWFVPPALNEEAFAAVRSEMVLNACKWDPQVGDVSTLARWPLVLRAATWRQLARWAERLTAEALAAERELLSRADGPRLWKALGLPRPLRHALHRATDLGFTPTAARVVRYDFHWTADGWRISEANADVPGGFSEAGTFAALVAAHYPDTRTAGDPAATWADAVAHAAGGAGTTAALLNAPGYMEDHQVVSYLAARLRERGLTTHLATPEQLRWRDGVAHLAVDPGPLDVVVRFYQGEWLATRRGNWRPLLQGGRTAVTNPLTAMLVESKRFPLVWDALRTPLPTWRALLPETRSLYTAPWLRDDGWLLKSALSNNGDAVAMRSLMTRRQWRSTALAALCQPRDWLAQRRFEALPVDTPDGSRYPCVGVYTVDGRAVGAYGRVATRPLVDYAAVDVAVLIERESPPDLGDDTN